jgi:hypothetical protein
MCEAVLGPHQPWAEPWHHCIYSQVLADTSASPCLRLFVSKTWDNSVHLQGPLLRLSGQVSISLCSGSQTALNTSELFL